MIIFLIPEKGKKIAHIDMFVSDKPTQTQSSPTSWVEISTLVVCGLTLLVAILDTSYTKKFIVVSNMIKVDFVFNFVF